MPRFSSAFVAFAFLLVARADAQTPRLLRDINTAAAPVAESAPKSFAAVGSDIYFNAYTPEVGFEVYRTRGTAATTTFVADALPGVDSSHAAYFAAAGAWTVFLDGLGLRLYRTDGTASGTAQLFDFGPPVKIASRPATRSFRGRAIVASKTVRGAPVHVLLATDGTPAGTIELATLPAYFGERLSVESFTEFGNELWFLAPNGLRHELWRTDGTVAGTRSFPATGLLSGPLLALGGALWFTAQTGTQLVIRGLDLAAQALPVSRVGDKILVARDDAVSGSEPWIVEERAAAQPRGVGCGDPAPLALSSHDPVLGDLLRFSVTPARPAASAVLLLGQVPGMPLPLDSGSCALHVVATAPVALLPMIGAGAGHELTLRVPMQASLSGVSVIAQALRTGNGWLGLDLSNGLELTFGR